MFTQYLLLFVATVPVFFAIDLLWLGVIGKPLYDKYLGGFMREKIQWPAAILFYVLYIVGILIFAVTPAIRGNGGFWMSAGYGALFGFFAYMTYELTNYAVIKNWPWQIVPIDIVWGVVLTGSVAGFSMLIAQAIF